MRYKKSKKILIDKRKLDTLLRLNCPKQILIDLIFENKLTLTGDSLIDDNLEALLEIKEFDNWGGSREGAGRKQKNQDENHLENQLEIQDEKHLKKSRCFQVGDKDKDIDKDLYIQSKYSNLELNSIPLKEKENLTKEKESEKDEGVKALRGIASNTTADTGSFRFDDPYFNMQIQKVFALYRRYCPSLIPIRFENRTKGRLDEIREFLEIINFDFSYVEELCKRANEQKTFYKNRIGLKSLIKNHAEIYEGLGAQPDIESQGNTQNSQMAKLQALADEYRAQDALEGADNG